MAEANARPSVIGGWLRTAATSLCGLAGGAVLMYLTPLLNQAVKPPEPVANFGYQTQGLSATFQNRAANATDGWWDFGDGSPLEAFSPQQTTVTHTYPRADTYNVKLSLTNLFNEKNERSIPVKVDGAGTAAPAVELFEVTPLSPGMAAPAVFHLVAKVKNADLIVWSYDGVKPIEVSTETGGAQERWITVAEPGCYTFRVVAAGGKHTTEAQSRPQWVGMASGGDPPTATVTVTYEAVHVERRDKVVPVRLTWPHDSNDVVCPCTGEWPAWQGFQIVKAELAGAGKDVHVRGVPQVAIAPDRLKVVVQADMIRPTGLTAWMQHTHQVPVRVTLEKRSAPAAQTTAVPMPLKVPGQTVIPIAGLPGGFWQATQRQVALDVAEGTRKLWSGTSMPANQVVQMQGRPVSVSATVQANQVVLTVTDPRSLAPAGN